jgi:hypothetical protein
MPETWKKLHTAVPGQDYALGWVTAARPWTGGPAFWHNGTNTLFFAIAWVAPARDRIFVAATNAGGLPGPGSLSTDAAVEALSLKYAP